MEAFKRNVRTTECERATCYREKHPTSTEPDPEHARSENGDKK